ncbi:MAG: response regulator [Victivallales bacterium]|nr:response regulator [Victivallales bacterium]
MTEEKGKINVFMVDDNPDDIELTLEAFRETQSEYGFSFDVAQDGIEAMDYLRKNGDFASRPTPDIILLDLNMPRMNGFEVLAELKKDPELKNIPVVILSISQNPDDMKRVNELNANSYIVKPMNMEDYIIVVKKLEMVATSCFFSK